MNYLLDTHALLWWLEDNLRLTDGARSAIRAPENLVHVSAASVWEASIKRARGNLRFANEELISELSESGFSELAITAQHALAAGELPPHHQDPFDRMLIAQALAEGLTMITHDSQFERYGIPILPT